VKAAKVTSRMAQTTQLENGIPYLSARSLAKFTAHTIDQTQAATVSANAAWRCRRLSVAPGPSRMSSANPTPATKYDAQSGISSRDTADDRAQNWSTRQIPSQTAMPARTRLIVSPAKSPIATSA
jgi:hypothetical protein